MVAITAALVGSITPQAVQVSMSGLSSGDDYEVVGVWSGGTWPVRGGVGTSNGSLLVLNDLAAPINIPVTYRVTSGVDVVDSAPVTVPFARRYALTSLDGRTVVTMRLRTNGLPRTPGLRPVMFDIPGRSDPVVVTDVPTTYSGEFEARTDAAGSAAMRDLLDLGGLAVLRTDGTVRDLPATGFLLITAAPSALLGAGIDDRQWSLSYRLLADPEPGSVPAVSTWEDVKTSYAGLTYADVKAEWAGQTWRDFRTFDWQSRASA